MGNVNARGDTESGMDDPSSKAVQSPYQKVLSGISRRDRATSMDSMGNTPPGSPGRSHSPLMFAPQVPLAPLKRVTDAPPSYQTWMTEPLERSDVLMEKGIPAIIHWNYGGSEVLVEGSWDGFSSRKLLQRSGKDHSILLVLPSGVYLYRFIVDGHWRYIEDLPCTVDEKGDIHNILDVNEYVPENVESIAEFEQPHSPDSSYGQAFLVEEDFAKEPPAVPPQLHFTVLGVPNASAPSTKPKHVVLNHLYIEKGWASQSLVALGLTHRFESKYVTVVLYKPLTRR